MEQEEWRFPWLELGVVPGRLTWVAEPFYYPDGEVIHIIATPLPNGWKISDDGDTEWYRSGHGIKNTQTYHKCRVLLKQVFGIPADCDELGIEVFGENSDVQRDEAATKLVAAIRILVEIAD